MVKDPILGKLTVAVGRYPEKDELDAAAVFIKRGIDVDFLSESRTEGLRSADIQMQGVVWEIKTPHGRTRRTIERQFHRASGQSTSIIIDSRRSAISDKKFRDEVERQWRSRKGLRRVYLILKTGEIVDFHR